MKLIDAHSHIDDKRFSKDFDEVMERAKNELEFFVNIGVDLETSKRSIEFAKNYSYVYATVGVHPHDVKNYNALLEEQLEELAKNKEVLAIGEIGLDYYKDYSPRDVQRDVFRKQLEMAMRVDKPVVIHMREATEDTVKILEEYSGVRGIIHSYSGSAETAERLKDRFYFSISGPVTFKNATRLREVVKSLPLDRILVETDCPYLTPEPNRGKRNEPSYVKYVAKKVADIHGIELEELIKITNINTKKAYEIE
ncbi:MAG: TatD family hydrolase [Fusobacteriota bacterium]